MFLSGLENEEKNIFLSLAHFVASCDGDFSEEEESIIRVYCQEMGINDISFDKESFNLDSVLKNITNKATQKIFLMEIYALVYSDGYLHKEESRIINVIVDNFEMDQNVASICKEWSKAILALVEQGKNIISL